MLLPDHETAVDFLNYEAISTTVVELLKENRQRALTIGIHGDWGAGKSSVLKMVQAAMEKDDKVSCLWFNGWTFQGFDDAKTVLIEATIAELCRQRSSMGKVKEIGGRLIKRIDWLKLMRRGTSLAFTLSTGLPSPDVLATVFGNLQQVAGSVKSKTPEEIEAMIKEAASFLKPGEDRSVPEEIHQFREEFAELLDEAKIDQLVVLIDDLDRCLPATAIDTLEAIRLFLFVPKTAFIIGADEGMIEYAVREHFPNLTLASGAVPYARHYLEKLIQVPFRIPALGNQESRSYVTLLLVEALVGDSHAGFNTLLSKARQTLNQPWLGSGVAQADVQAVDASLLPELDGAFLLAQQIGPILADGTKGNPRQIKRFINSLLVRLAIAKARGFANAVNRAVLAKVMLAERFQPDYYEQLADGAMRASDGIVAELHELETSPELGEAERSIKKDAKPSKPVPAPDAAGTTWRDSEWLRRWLKIQPALGALDLRPYVFVARDKRALATLGGVGGLEALIESLIGSEIAVRSVEPQVKALPIPEAEQLFASLRDRVITQGSFTTQPAGFSGLMIIAKHHPRYQKELLTMIAGIDAKALGFWVAKGWDEVLTEAAAIEQKQTLLNGWAAQTDNVPLQKAASRALSPVRKRGT